MQNLQEVQSAVATLSKLLPENGDLRKPVLGLILGTGLSDLAAAIRDSIVIPFADVPGFPHTTADSHAGAFIAGWLGNLPVIAQQGRYHLYEGRSPSEICLGVRVMAGLGVSSLVVTNAAGALNPVFEQGGIMCMSDHINLTGVSPLTGPNCAEWGERFPDMSAIYDRELQSVARKVALDLGIRLESGVYIAVHGPELESPAETRMYRMMGADAIGMSTVLEVIAARHLGLRVLGFSCLTNKNLPDCMEQVSISEIIDAAGRSGKELARLLGALAENCGSVFAKKI